MSDQGSTTLQILTGISSALASITTANGYTTNLSAGNIYDPLSLPVTATNRDQDFPKVTVFFFKRKTEFFPQLRRMHTGTFVIESQFKQTAVLTTLAITQAHNFLRDLELYILANYTLGGLAEEVRLMETQAAYSGGTPPPYAALAFLEVDWFNQPG